MKWLSDNYWWLFPIVLFASLHVWIGIARWLMPPLHKPTPVAPDEWDFKAKLCGNCKYWPLSRYYAARASEGGEPSGQGGPHTNGSMSDCRACLPGTYEWPGYGATRWPQVKRDDWCKEFEQRDWLKVEENAQ